jgi:preprotein translocase subunit SecG
MTAVILTIHSLIVLALIGVVLLQRSDGGALGLGGGGGGFMTGRGAANALTRTTSILAAAFFATSLLLAIRAGGGENADDVINELTGTEAPAAGQPADDGELSAEELLNSLGAGDEEDAATAEELLRQEGVDAPAAVETTAPAEEPEAATPEESGEPEPETPNQ